ncbi:MAG: hypothetical protein H0V09_01615 [Gemmatimonadetes bacterium]|nr:hypothetical protein [Gemmatimonadota bacterium]
MRRSLNSLAARAIIVAGLLFPAGEVRGEDNSWIQREDDPWIHIQVVETGADAANVQVHLPLSMVRLALDMAPDEAILDGHVRIENSDISVAEMRRLWTELKAAGEADFVTVEKAKETVRIGRRGQRLLIRVTDSTAGKEHVAVDVPLAIVDVLLAGDGERLNVAGAIATLGAYRGEVLNVQDGQDRVRIWVDEKSGSE